MLRQRFFKNFLFPCFSPPIPTLPKLHLSFDLTWFNLKKKDWYSTYYIAVMQQHINCLFLNRYEAGDTHISDLIHCMCTPSFYGYTPSWCTRGSALSLANLLLISLDLPTFCFQRFLLFKGFLFVVNSSSLHIKWKYSRGFLLHFQWLYCSHTCFIHGHYPLPLSFVLKPESASHLCVFIPFPLWSQYLCILSPHFSPPVLLSVACSYL